VAAVFTPKDYAITEIMGRIVTVIREAHGLSDLGGDE
jgi:(2R)-ethylmalonyl-CoA mutase